MRQRAQRHGTVRDLFADAVSRSEVVVTFLALLELIRLKQIVAVQPEPFGEIEIRRVEQTARALSPAGFAESNPQSN
mgnify:CR=1 FL=1